MSAKKEEHFLPEEDEVIEEVDPRIKDELDSLNCAGEEINKLETELELGRGKFRSLFADSHEHLKQLGKKLGKCVNKARPYYDVLKQAKQAETELQHATVKFQRANSEYKAAKETVARAEEGKSTAHGEEDVELDSAWQEMMNYATQKFMKTEAEKRTIEAEHQICATRYAAVQAQRLALEKDMPRTIKRAKSYFEMKERLESRLQQERQSVEDLQRALTASKERYTASLKALEVISEEIHKKRKCKKDKGGGVSSSSLPPRTPGVGAETSSSGSEEIIAKEEEDLPTINLDGDNQSVASSDLYLDDSDVASVCSRDSYYMDHASSARPSPYPSPGPSPSHHQRGLSCPPGLSWDQRSTTSSVGSGYSSQSGSYSHISHEERLSLALQAKSAEKLLRKQQEEEEERRREEEERVLEEKRKELERLEIAKQLQEKFSPLKKMNNPVNGPLSAPKLTRTTPGARSISPAPRSASPGGSPSRNASPSSTATPASPSSSHKLFESHARDRIESQRKSRSRQSRSEQHQHFPILDGLSRTNRQLSPKLSQGGRPRGHDLGGAAAAMAAEAMSSSRPRSVERSFFGSGGTQGSSYGTAQEISGSEQVDRAFFGGGSRGSGGAVIATNPTNPKRRLSAGSQIGGGGGVTGKSVGVVTNGLQAGVKPATPPPHREKDVRNIAEHPGIISAAANSENHVAHSKPLASEPKQTSQNQSVRTTNTPPPSTSSSILTATKTTAKTTTLAVVVATTESSSTSKASQSQSVKANISSSQDLNQNLNTGSAGEKEEKTGSRRNIQQNGTSHNQDTSKTALQGGGDA